jgi:hypothetical protein
MNTAGNREQTSANAHAYSLTIYKDDHRNNHDFLKKHPNTVVLPYRTPKKIKPPHHQTSVDRHNPNTQTRSTHPSVRKSSPTHVAQNGVSVNTVESHNDYELEDARYSSTHDEGDSSTYETENENSFLFHEIAAEEYDAEIDLFEQPETERVAVYLGTDVNFEPNTPPIDTIKVDPNSFILQTDAQDGSVTFKASILFDMGIDLDDYEVIVTHITT